MWRIISIYDLEENCNLTRLSLALDGGKYLVSFYNTVTRVTEEMQLTIDMCVWHCIVGSESNKSYSWYDTSDFICKRYNWDLQHASPNLFISDKYFMKVEEKLKMVKPFKSQAVYRYGVNSSANTLKDMFDAYYTGVAIDGTVRLLDAKFELLCRENEFNTAYTKYCIMRGKRNAK